MLYKEAGVDVGLGDEFVRRIKSLAESTFGPRVLTKLGGFTACYSLDDIGHQAPVLVASTDGVGTKLKVAFMVDRHDTVGIDLVAMCVNDILVRGAQPLFSFLQEEGRISEEEMWRTFNNGIGMILVVRAEEAERLLTRLKKLEEEAYLIGEITAGKGKVKLLNL